jgi:predicted RNA methylase
MQLEAGLSSDAQQIEPIPMQLLRIASRFMRFVASASSIQAAIRALSVGDATCGACNWSCGMSRCGGTTVNDVLVA